MAFWEILGKIFGRVSTRPLPPQYAANTQPWHDVIATSFADPDDIARFWLCKAKGMSDKEAFRFGDNGIGKWGDDTTLDRPMCALPPEDWSVLPKPRGVPVLVRVGERMVRCELRDTMPRKKNIKNGAGIDLNPAACAHLGLTPPIRIKARWRWAD